MDDQQKINELIQKLDQLLRRQDQFQMEINQLRAEIYRLKSSENQSQSGVFQTDPLLEEELPEVPLGTIIPEEEPETFKETQPDLPEKAPKKPWFGEALSNSLNFEKFIGENLINKIGILITIIGVVIGARYAIENQLISPLTRIIIGYLFGFGLLATAFRLKKDYQGFSAVLLSGAMAILYFITFAAFSFYALIPSGLAFGLMLLFTVFTVVAALNYDQQVIAIVGLVGAYAVPFLLSSGTGEALYLFTYMALINTGILVIAFRKYWKPLYYTAFVFTWMLYFAWFWQEYSFSEGTYSIAFGFALVFFLLFYLTFLAYKLLNSEVLQKREVIFVLLNSFIFYGIGYAIIQDNAAWEKYLGLFTLFNAGIHFLISVLIYRKSMATRSLFFLVSGLVLIFLTIAIPVQLDGNWVTLLWIGEAALLFWLGRSRQLPVYEGLSFLLMMLGLASLVQDWDAFYVPYYYLTPEDTFRPLVNIQFLTSIIFVAAFSWIVYLQQKFPPTTSRKWLVIFESLIPLALLCLIFSTFYLEIKQYWEMAYAQSAVTTRDANNPEYTQTLQDYNLLSFQNIWLTNYTMLFASLLIAVYLKWFKAKKWDWIVSGLAVFSLLGFLTVGLYELSELRESYINRASEEYFVRGPFHLYIRYISYLFCGILFWSLSKVLRPLSIMVFDLILAAGILWLASAELITIRQLLFDQSDYKLGLSLLWGFYALILVILGIWQKKRHLRIGAIVLFAITLLKLFAYDLVNMTTISKTIVLVSLGLLLLVISFLYNKYQIGDEDKKD